MRDQAVAPGDSSPPGAAAPAPRTARGPRPVRAGTACGLGRTICAKPKPLIAVLLERLRQIGVEDLGRPRDAHPFRAASGNRCRWSRRCPAVGSRAPQPRRAICASLAGVNQPSTSITVIAAVGWIRSSPPSKRTMPVRASSRRSSHRRRWCRRGLPRSAAPGWAPRRAARERPLPRLAAAERLARDLDQEAGAFSDAGDPRGRRNVSPPASTVDARCDRPTSLASRTVAGARSRRRAGPRLDDLAVLDRAPRGSRRSRARSATQASRISGGLQQHAASRPAAGRRRWNSCRRCGGHRLRHSPGARSRRPCRAIRRGRRNSRFLRRYSRFIAIIVSTSRSRTPPPGIASATPVSTRCRRPDSSCMQARKRRFVLDLGQDAPPDRDHRVGGEHQRVGLVRPRPPRPSRAPAAAHGRAAARPWARSRRCRRERPRRARRRCGQAGRGGAGSPRRGSAAVTGSRAVLRVRA